MKRKSFYLVLAIALAALIPSVASAQGRGRGNGNGNGNGNGRGNSPVVFGNGGPGNSGNQARKCAKFVNCHDASEGRWDGRGPRVNGGVVNSPIYVPLPTSIRIPGTRSRRVIHRKFAEDGFDREEMLRQERIAERRYFADRGRRLPY